MNDNAVEAVVDKRQQIAEQLGEHVHGSHHEIRYGPNNHQTWSRQAQGRWQEPPSRRRGPLHPAARRHDGRVVTVGPLVLFSTETGDAWLLDPADQLASRLAHDGDPEPIHIEETDTTFAIGWKGRFRIEGPAFIYVDHDTGQVSTILGYPTHKLNQIG